MAITRTYAVGQENTVRRLDNYIGPWVDVSIPIIPTTSAMTCYDVMADPNDPDTVIVVGNISTGNTGIMMSRNAGGTWFKPGGVWLKGILLEVWWVNSDVIWIVGTGGLVLLSTDSGSTFNAVPTAPQLGAYEHTSCIHAISDKIAVVSGTLNATSTSNDVLVWKTIDGGASWTTLNGNTTLVNTGLGGITGTADGIHISDDEQIITVGTGYTQQRTVTGGFAAASFTDLPPAMNRSGKHLTWFPSHGIPNIFRHVGGATHQVSESLDGGATWTLTRNTEGLIIRGAHFYSALNGYYIIGGETFYTTDGGITGTLSDPIAETKVDKLNAVWTGDSTLTYCLTSCEDSEVILYSENLVFDIYIGQTVNLDIPGYGSDTCWSVEQCNPPTGWEEQEVISVITAYENCEECSPPEPSSSMCYDLVSCNGGCDDHLGVQAPFIAPDPIIGSLWYINGDQSCIYEVYPLRQAIYAQDTYTDFSLPGGDFQLGNDDHTFQVTSLILDGVEYITTPVITYIMNEVNYQPVECTGVSCVNVLPNTTENGWSNLATYLNAIFDLFNLTLEAFPCDPTACEIDYIDPVSLFKILYREGSEFQISIQRIAPISGLQQIVVTSLVGNISYETINAVEFTTCNSNVYCPVTQQIQINTVDFWDGPCVPDPAPVELGKACAIEPRIGEPGFSFKNCDPKEVIRVKTNYANSVYALFKRIRYGIETCCEFDLDKIKVKNKLLELGKLYDPDICEDNSPLLLACCPAPCNAIATLLIPLAVSCPAPTNAVVELVTGEPILLCIPPTGIPADSGTPLTANAVLFIG